MKNLFFILPFLILGNLGFSQESTAQLPTGYMVTARIENGDTIPLIYLPEVRITENRVFKNARQAAQYNKLKRDVKRVYPYAILAAAKLKEYDAKLATIPTDAQRKVYMKRAEKELKNQFEDDLKKLTMTQGRILIKLIDRETGATSYDLVKQLRGSFSAFMWQSMARLFGSNLKAEYDAKGDDRMIEQIILLIEANEI